jgi:hypothetical protein
MITLNDNIKSMITPNENINVNTLNVIIFEGLDVIIFKCRGCYHFYGVNVIIFEVLYDIILEFLMFSF